MKIILQVFVFLFVASTTMSQGSFGDIQGQIFERSDKDLPASFARVWVERGSSKFTAMADEDGRFTISAVPVGIYPVKIIYNADSLGYDLYADVKVNGISFLGRVNFYEDITIIDEFTVKRFIDPLINHGNVGERTINTLDIQQSAVKTDMKALIMSRNSDIQTNNNGEMIIRGSRPNDLIYYIDGVKTGEVSNVPSSAIGSVTIYTNAIPAQYGDTNGGVIIMETKSYYDLWRDYEMRMNR